MNDININILKPYIIKLNNFFLRLIDNDLREVGYEEALNRQYKYIDCTRMSTTTPNMRLVQTIDHTYKLEISKTLEIINKIEDETEQENALAKLLEIHKRNIDFEQENPPTVYKKGKSKSSTRKIKEPKIKVGDESEKLTPLQKRVAKKVAQFKTLNISIKPIKHG